MYGEQIKGVTEDPTHYTDVPAPADPQKNVEATFYLLPMEKQKGQDAGLICWTMPSLLGFDSETLLYETFYFRCIHTKGLKYQNKSFNISAFEDERQELYFPQEFLDWVSGTSKGFTLSRRPPHFVKTTANLFNTQLEIRPKSVQATTFFPLQDGGFQVSMYPSFVKPYFIAKDHIFVFKLLLEE